MQIGYSKHVEPSGPSFTIGEYPVVRHIAQGGMGAIYEVTDPITGAAWAMKLAAHNREETARFARIHASLGPLSHPNLCDVHKFGVTGDGRAYLLLELVDGEPAQVFAKSLGRAGIHERTEAVITVMIQLADALAYLHDHGIIHRDVKSANVLVSSTQRMHLVDFGSAVLPGVRTPPGRFVGTYTYASPEQIRGESVDGRTDLYAMGVLLYRMLTGHRPFHADTTEQVIDLHLNHPPRPVEDLVPHLPPALCTIVHHLLAKDRNQRPESAREVMAALREI